MLTVESVWKEALPPGTALVGGEGGLGREVGWAVTLRARPPAFGNLRGGELALLSVARLRVVDETLTLARAVEALAALEVAAIGAVGEIDEAARCAAAALKMPLFALPPGTDLQEVEHTVSRLITDQRTALYQRSQDLFRQLADLAIQGRGVPAVVDRLCQVTGRAVALEDTLFRLQIFRAPPHFRYAEQELVYALKGQGLTVKRWFEGQILSPSDPPVGRFELVHPLARLVAPVVGRAGPRAYLSVLGSPGELSDIERLAVARAAAACAIEIVREHAMLDAQDRMQGDLIEDLLAGNYPNEEMLLTRARRLGYDLTRPHLGLALQVGAAEQGGTSGNNGHQVWQEQLERHLRLTGVEAPYRQHEQIVTLLYPVPAEADETQAVRLAERLKTALEDELGTVTVGVGGLHGGLEGLRLGCHEAEQALALGLRLFGCGSVTVFGRLGLYRLLFSLGEQPELRTFQQEMLGKLLDYDRRNGAELVPTLEALLVANNSPTEAAARLHLHRNTMLYRLKRIEDIADVDLHDPETRLALYLALRIGQTLRATDGKG